MVTPQYMIRKKPLTPDERELSGYFRSHFGEPSSPFEEAVLEEDETE